MEILQQYIELSVALGVFIFIEILKRTVPKLNHQYIPILSAILGIIFVVWAKGVSLSFDNVLLGIVSGGSSTWLYEVIDQFKPVKEVNYFSDSMGDLE